jgi:hypothetical protein
LADVRCRARECQSAAQQAEAFEDHEHSPDEQEDAECCPEHDGGRPQRPARQAHFEKRHRDGEHAREQQHRPGDEVPELYKRRSTAQCVVEDVVPTEQVRDHEGASHGGRDRPDDE